MFSKNDSKIKNLENIVQSRMGNDKRPMPPSIISADMMISGDVFSEGEIHIDGKLDGDIKCRILILGVASEVSGTITADTVKIHGKFNGQIVAGSVLLASTAYMTGDITHESIEIEPGAYLEGHCHRQSDPIPAEQGPSDLMISDQSKGDKNSQGSKSLVEGKKDAKTA